MTNTTERITSTFKLAADLAAFKTTNYSINAEADGTFTISFDNAEAAIGSIEKAKAAAFAAYLRAGGNPRNKRAFGSSFAAAKRAVLAAEGV